MKKRPLRIDWYRIGGASLLLWAAANTWVSATRYGIDQGMYWWFCNLAMIGIGYGLWTHHRGWLVGFISIASFTQTFWIFDNVWRISTGENLFGLVEFMYRPGNPMDEFLLSHYHFFILPAGILGALFLKEKRDLPVWAVIATNAFIFGMSYFAFPAIQNVNCAHEPCVPSLLHWKGPLYSILFPSTVCLCCVLLYNWMRGMIERHPLTENGKRIAIATYSVITVMGVGISLVDIKVKQELPALTCADPFEKDGISVACRFTLDYTPNVVSFVYHIANGSRETRTCRTFLEHDGRKEQLADNVLLPAGLSKDLKTLLDYPVKDLKVTLSAVCTPSNQSGRNTAWDPR